MKIRALELDCTATLALAQSSSVLTDGKLLKFSKIQFPYVSWIKKGVGVRSKIDYVCETQNSDCYIYVSNRCYSVKCI